MKRESASQILNFSMASQIAILLLLSFLNHGVLLSQTYPYAYNLSIGNYSFSEWQSNSAEGAYPANMRFHTISRLDALLSDEPNGDWTMSYNLTSRARILGNGATGFSFLNTSTPQPSAGYPSAAVLAVNSTGRSNIRVNWTGRTIASAEREYTIALQYRVGVTGQFKDLNSRYTMSAAPGFENMSISLPSDADDKELVHIRWLYYFSGAGTGTRPNLGVDDIVVSSQPIGNSADRVIIESIEPQIPLSGIPFRVKLRFADANGFTSGLSENTIIKIALQSDATGGDSEANIPAGAHNYEFTLQSGITINKTGNFTIKAESVSGAELLSSERAVTVVEPPKQLKYFDFFGNVHLGMPLPTFTVSAIKANGLVSNEYTGYEAKLIAMGSNGNQFLFSAQFNNGVAVFDGILIDAPDIYSIRVEATGLPLLPLPNSDIKPLPEMKEIIVPRFIKGAGDINNASQMRLPAYSLVRFDNLHPNTEYRFITGCRTVGTVLPNDEGAGNNFHTDYSTGKSFYSNVKSRYLNQPGNYSTFKTGEGETSRTIWISVVPTANAVFNENNEIYWIVSFGNERFGVIDRFHSNNTAQCLSFGTQSQPGKATGIFDRDSRLSSGGYLSIYSNNIQSDMPIATVAINPCVALLAQLDEQGNVIRKESPKFFADLESIGGSWAGFIPNKARSSDGSLLSCGINRIVHYGSSGAVLQVWNDDDGVWAGVNTNNPTGAAVNPIEFETPYLKLKTPSANEDICNSGKYEITWESRGIQELKLNVFDANDKLFEDIIPAKSGLYKWQTLRGKYNGKPLYLRIYSSEQVSSAGESFLFINDEPVIREISPSAVYCRGGSAELYIISDGDIYSYQWLKDGKPIEGGSEPVLSLENLDFSSSGAYSCKMDGGICGNRFSNDVFVYIARETEVVWQPSNIAAMPGGEAVFTVEAHINGAPPDFMPQFQWKRGSLPLTDNERISGAKSNILRVSNVRLSDYGDDYSVEIKGLCQETPISSNSAELFYPEIYITANPVGDTICEGGRVTFSARAESKYGAGKLCCNWLKDGIELENDDRISGANDFDLIVDNLKLSDAGNYIAIFTLEPYDIQAQTNVANLSVLNKPKIVLQPDSLYLGQIGRQLVLGAGAEGAEPILYQWYKDGAPISGANWLTYVKDNISDEDAGEYRCKISNNCGEVWTRSCYVTVTYEQYASAGKIAEAEGVLLYPPEPNPVTALANISYYLPNSQFISITLLDASGREIVKLAELEQSVGYHRLDFDAVQHNIASGIYIISLRAHKVIITQKLAVVK